MANPIQRRKARSYAVQAIYQWQMTQADIVEVESQFLAELADENSPLMLELKGGDEQLDLGDMDRSYFSELLCGVALNSAKLDETMKPYLARKLDELDQVEKAILRMALYEMTISQSVPPKVAINEAIEIAKAFGGEDSHKFINGVLDKVIKLRQRLDQA